MSNPGDPNYLSRLDAEQVLRAAWDENIRRLRTDATFSGTLSVSLDASNDSVAIGDGVDLLAINPDGSLNANITGTLAVEIDAADGDNIAIKDSDGDELEINTDGSINVNSIVPTSNTYNEVTSVASGILTTIHSYTALSNAYLLTVDVAGTNVAYYEVQLNASVIDKKYTYFGGQLNASFDFGAQSLIASDVVTVKVLHNRPTVGDFNAKIQIRVA